MVFLNDLIYNNRLEPRAGLPKKVIEELLLLKTMSGENTNSADVIQLDNKKIAAHEEKGALLEARKAEKLKAVTNAERIAKENSIQAVKSDSDEASFEFTLIEKTNAE